MAEKNKRRDRQPASAPRPPPRWSAVPTGWLLCPIHHFATVVKTGGTPGHPMGHINGRAGGRGHHRNVGRHFEERNRPDVYIPYARGALQATGPRYKALTRAKLYLSILREVVLYRSRCARQISQLGAQAVHELQKQQIIWQNPERNHTHAHTRRSAT